MKPAIAADDPQTNYGNFDSQLTISFPMIKHAHRDLPEDQLEADGPSMKRPEVNIDNAKLYGYPKKMFERHAP